MAAYGKHPSITGATTLAGKRAAAKAIVDPTAAPATDPAQIPADAADFMYGTGAWADQGGETTTGLEDVDLWVGGLAEVTNLNGGLLGSTFNYVFQTQLENLQDGDRFYYLARTPGMNLRTQLEGNTFAELIQRNTDGTHTLKADVFATADCKFELGHLDGTPAGFAQFGATVADDPTTTDCDESLLLLRKPDGTIQYRQRNAVDPPGINGQSVYNGTPGLDRVYGGNDNDTFWGGAGNDVIEGNGGDDVPVGGDGSDIITDLDGADTLKGGPGNDALDAGPGDDLVQGGDGQDFANGGANDNETFAGPGNDFVIAGQGADAVFGDGGDDWIQGGSGQDLLQGDHGAPFFDDPGQAKPGNDIFVGQVGENDYDAEGGDDIMAQNAAIDRNAGAGGFDWAIHQYDTVGADDDMMINQQLAGLPIQLVVNRDRWQETEADSGSALDDVIRGDDRVPSTLGGAGFSGCDVLDQAGLDRISGLAAILPQPLTGDPNPVVAASAAGFCPISGPIWGDGNILLGGAGSDTLEGRGADDVIDGDRYLNVRISVRTDPADPATEIGSTDLMEHQYLRDANGRLVGPTLQQAVFAGTVDPGNLVAVREILSNPGSDDVDTAVFQDVRANYTVTRRPDGAVIVNHTTVTPGLRAADGIDTLWNIEQLKFSDETIPAPAPVVLTAPGAPTGLSAVASNTSATVNWTAPANDGGSRITGFELDVRTGTTVVRTITGITGTANSLVVTGLTNGTAYNFVVRAVNAVGTGPDSAPSDPVTPARAPSAPTIGTAVGGNAQATVSWTAPANDGGSPITGYELDVRVGTTLVRSEFGIPADATSTVVAGLTNGTTYSFVVRAVNAAGVSANSAASNTVTPATVPGRPVIGSAQQGANGGALTAIARWSPPATNGGSAITGYRVTALRMSSSAANATVVSRTNSPVLAASARTREFTLPAGNYRFEVVAINAVGTSAPSARSNNVVPR